MYTFLDCIYVCFIVLLPPIQSFITEDDSELIEELKVDIAADSTPANKRPLIPTGR